MLVVPGTLLYNEVVTTKIWGMHKNTKKAIAERKRLQENEEKDYVGDTIYCLICNELFSVYEFEEHQS